MTALISILHLIFTIISHPLQYYFPKTTKGFSLTAGIDKIPDYKQFVVCPNLECCELYDINASLEAGSIPNCITVKYGSQCKQSIFYERFLSFGKSRYVPCHLLYGKFYSNKSFKRLLSVQKCYTPECEIINDMGYGNHLEQIMAMIAPFQG